jgi:4-oxalocrotonate tautomerase
MPLVRISVYEGTTKDHRQAIASEVYRAMREAIGIPEGDLFVVVTAHSAEEFVVDRTFMGMQRTDRFTLIHIFLSEGRTIEQKQLLFDRIACGLRDGVGISTDDVMTVLTENSLSDWSFGKGRAQYVLNPPAWARAVAAGD